VAWTALAGSSLALVLGRQGRPFRSRERHQLLALAKVAQHVLKRLGRDPEPVVAGSHAG
jgi:hypothetical protein